jgi:hypothetical protein
VHGAAGGAAGREAGASVEGGRRDRLPPRTGALGRGTVDRQATGAGVPLAEGRDAPGHRAERPASARVAEFG